MASATTRLAFSFHNSTQPYTKPHHSHHIFLPSKPAISLKSKPQKGRLHFTVINSIDVSKEDIPSSDQEEPKESEEEKMDKRRLEEKFAVLNTGIYECRSCGFKYDEALGDPSYPIPPGFEFEKLPDDWRCPTCGAAQSFFENKSVEIAGFAQNQQYGLGGNTLTSGQKALLIYGSLFFFFVLFLSGYFLQ
ncbi:Rubredoxin [Hibiscus syriacus]|uniref:Rubredoxin n=1 Tax=Hibiscus syriacus TaxID=106335 RepID=A0A6A2YZK9_HIBSY|nr:rubredoxin-like [Hibiscus syriacus]KAE8684988.1 Rubredoxin [Hibiscus syriacus]